MVPSARALAVLLGVALLFTGLVTALAVQRDAEPVMAGEVPLPREGDVVAYVSGNPEGWRVARWLGTNTTVDAYGRPVEADVLDLASDTFSFGRAYFEAGQVTPFASESAGVVEGGGETARASIHTSYADDWTWTNYNWNHPCLVRSGWQGLALAEVSMRSVAELCPQLAGEARDIRPMGTDTLLGRTAQRFTFWNGTSPVLTVWLAPDVPYPLAAARCSSATAAGCNGRDPAEVGTILHRYEPGDGPHLRAATARAVPPEPTLAPFTRTGPQDGRAGAFTLEQAAEGAESDPTLTRFQAWRRAHPEARIAEAAYGDSTASPSSSPSTNPFSSRPPTWTLVYQGADETRYRVTVVEPATCGAAGGARLPVCPPAAYEDERAERIDFPPRTYPDRAVPVGAALALLPAAAGYDREARLTLDEESGTLAATWHLTSWLVGADGRQEGERDLRIDALTGQILDRRRIETVPLTTSPGEPSSTPPPTTSQPQHNAATLPPADSLTILAAAGTATGLTLLALGLLGPRLTAAAVTAYTRLTRRDVLQHPRRAQLLESIRRTPGLSTRDAETLLGIGSGATRHHLDILVRAGELARLQAGGYTRYYVAGSDDHHRLAEDAIQQAGRAEARLLQHLHDHPGIHAAQLARDLGISRAAVHQTLRRLQKRGLITQRKTPAGTIQLSARR